MNGSPADVTAITSGSVLPGNAFTLYVNGTFSLGGLNVRWLNTATNVTTVFPANAVVITPSGLSVAIPFALYQTLVANPVAVTVTLQDLTGVSNAATFTINPPLQAIQPNMPGGTINVPYSANIVTGGTPPFAEAGLTGGTLPPGLNAPFPTITISGTPTQTGVFNFQTTAMDFWGNIVSGNDTIQIVNTPPLGITTTALPSAAFGIGYSYTLTGTGGTPPYTWAASGLPPALSVASGTGVISGLVQEGGSYLVTVVLLDAAGATVNAQFPLVVGPPPLTIAPTSSMPSGVVGVVYQGSVFAYGGASPYTFSLGGGSLPDGVTLTSNGLVYGTPKTAGQFSFTVVVTDAAGGFASRGFSVTIQPAPLNITGGPTGPVAAGTPINITFTGTGGLGPYVFNLSGGLPPGTAFNNGVLSGTPTTAGAFTFRVTVTDSTGAAFSNSFTLTVTAAALSLGGSLSNGKVGVPYAGQIAATGGVSPYSYAGSGLPGGLTLSAAGAITGTPTTVGQFTLSATVTDSKGATAGGRFAIIIAPADLSIVTASLPDGVVGAAYSAALTASGGVPPYTWTVTGLPAGLTATAAGAIGGTPTTAGKFTVSATVKDASGAASSVGASVTRSFSLTIAPTPLIISTATAPNGTVGTAYSTSFAASGGTLPYTFSASGLPAGLSMSTAGAISGTPTAPGTATILVTVKDAAGASTSKSFTVTIGLPPAPPLNFNIAGISDTASPLQQPRLQVALGSGYPVDVVVTLTLTFAPDSGADDPTIQFSSGGRTARITVPAGATAGATDVGVQTGTVAGLIAITAQLQASGQDVTPSPAPRRTIRIAAAPPVIVPGTLTAVRNSTGFTVTLTGFATDREVTQAAFVFTAAAGSSLQTTTLTVALDAMFVTYFGGSSATPFGSQFTYTQPFTVSGSAQSIASVSVTLVNRIGQSTAVTATLN
jgi:hypothetical protein